MTKEELGWIAGVTDGEGCLSLRISGKHIRAYVEVLTNSNPLMIEKAASLLSGLNISHKVYSLSNGPKWQVQWKRAWRVVINTTDAMKEFLKLVQPHLVGKSEQARIIQEFLSRRKTRLPYPGSRCIDTECERLLMQRCRELNRRGNSESVTTSTPVFDYESKKIQSGLHGDMQSQAEMTWPEKPN